MASARDLRPRLTDRAIGMADMVHPPAFVTYGWCRTAYTVVRSLGRKGIPVHVGDSSALAMSRYSRYARSFTRLPDFFERPEEYFEQLCIALKRTGAKVLMPAHEDIELVIRWRNHLPDGVKICAPSTSMWEIAEDKALYVDHVEKAGCPVPRTHRVASADELDRLLAQLSMPAVLKTRIGNSAKGVRICKNPDECRTEFFSLIDEFQLTPDRWPVIQEYISGEKLGVLAYFKSGKHVASIVFQIVRSKGSSNFGTSTYRVVLDDPETKTSAIRAMEALEWDGVVDMDWLRDPHGTARLIDINGRLGGATALTVVSGMDMPYLWYLGALDQVPERLPDIKVGAKARWILGDSLGFVDSLRKGRWRECLDVLTPQRHCGHDDFVLSDPLPFLFQGLDYAAKFFRGGGSMNPTTAGMIR